MHMILSTSSNFRHFCFVPNFKENVPAFLRVKKFPYP